MACWSRNGGAERSNNDLDEQDGQVVDADSALSRLREAVMAVEAAPLRPARRYNRLMDMVAAECSRLAATTEGRSALTVAAAEDADLGLRLVAATAVARWDGDCGARALEDLVTRTGGRVVRPMTMTAALAVDDPVGRNAALCLLNVDSDAVTPADAAVAPVPALPVATDQLDAAERVYALAMNGGLGHAYEVAGTDFALAVGAFDALNLRSAAHALREVVRVLGEPATEADLRGAAVQAASDEVEVLLTQLDRELDEDDVMSALTSATEL